ncbi:uncharacterized protein [Apostichopus japonicus]|uniref:uncharacterized protein isoform X2 n=1 Tax=Stichopus japonicus TaxID=307972 RepID=UPI003AB21587
MSETGCGDSPTDGKVPTTSVTTSKINGLKSQEEEDRPDLVAKLAKLESQIEDVTSTLKDEQENRRLIQHELEASRSLCENLEETCQRQNGLFSQKGGWPSRKLDQGIQTEVGLGIRLKEENTTENGAVTQSGKEIPSGLRQHSNQYSAASQLLEEYTSNQKDLEYQVKKLSQECASKDEEMSRVGLKYAVFIKRNAQLEKEIESLRSNLSRNQQKIGRQERLLEMRNQELEEKAEALKQLKAQKNSLAEKYSQAKTKAAKLKEVVISFNKTVSEFRKEREKLLNSGLAARVTAAASKSSDAPQADSEVYRPLISPEECPPSVEVSPESPHGGYRGEETPEIETDRGTDSGPRHGAAHTTGETSCTSHERFSNIRRGNGRDHSHSRGGPVSRRICFPGDCRRQGDLRKEHHDVSFDEKLTWPRSLTDDSSGSGESTLSGSEVNVSRQIEDENSDSEDERYPFVVPADSRMTRREQRHRGRQRLPSDVVLRGTSSSRGSEAGAADEDDCAEGLILVKHDMENYALKARDRTWNYIYIVHQGRTLTFYESRDFVTLRLTLDGMDPIDLAGAIVCPLRDYVKRSFVFCVQLTNGARYLFQAQDESEMLYWICRLSTGTGDTQSGGMGRLFTQRRAPLRGSPSRTARLKNFIRGGLSAVWK